MFFISIPTALNTEKRFHARKPNWTVKKNVWDIKFNLLNSACLNRNGKLKTTPAPKGKEHGRFFMCVWRVFSYWIFGNPSNRETQRY
jgi:hypothetical protein